MTKRELLESVIDDNETLPNDKELLRYFIEECEQFNETVNDPLSESIEALLDHYGTDAAGQLRNEERALLWTLASFAQWINGSIPPADKPIDGVDIYKPDR